MISRAPRWASGVGLAAIAALLFAGIAGTANAASFSVTGTWDDMRGTVDLPLPPVLGGQGPKNPVNGTVSQTGAAVPGGGPSVITLPPGIIFDAPNLEGFLIPIPNVIQLTTSIGHSGPTTTTTLMASGGPGSLAICPGQTAVGPCTTVVAGGSMGTLNGILKYTAGPNKFGGTMKVLLSGIGKLIRKGTGAQPSTTMTTMGATIPALPFSGSTAPLGGSAPQPVGFTGMYTGMQSGGNLTHPLGYMTTPKGLITPGPIIGTGIAETNTATAYGLTTGTVYAYQQFGAQSNDPGSPSKVTLSGYDKRTAGGNGRIVLVTASLSRAFPTDGSDPPEGSTINKGILNITMVRQPALPLTSPAGLITLGSLVMMGAGYAIARRG